MTPPNTDELFHLSSKLLGEVIQLREGLEHLQRDMQHQPHQYPATEVDNAIRSIFQGDTE